MVVGQVRSIPKPKATVLDSATDFALYAAKYPSEARALLVEMKEVQTHNETVLEQAQASIIEAKTATAEAETAAREEQKAKAAMAVERSAQQADALQLTRKGEQLNDQEARLGTKARELTEQAELAAETQDRRNDELQAREDALAEKLADIDRLRETAEAYLAEAEALKTQARDRIDRIAAMGTGSA